jgi:hypothetical protein
VQPSDCVRRDFLHSVDTYTGQSYEHRRERIVDPIKQLTDIFAIECFDENTKKGKGNWLVALAQALDKLSRHPP